MLAFVFPGQGSQHRGMGQRLFDEVSAYAAAEREVDALLGYSLRQLCLQDPDNRLKQTQYTQPALYVVNALHYYQAVGRGEVPTHVSGHSLGEYNALLAAGAFDFITGLRLVKQRGELLAQAKDGGMAAVVGLGSARIPQLLQDSGLGAIDVANYNSPLQTVLSGPLAELQRAGPIFEKAGAKLYMPLQVSAAFHSRYVAGAARVFAEFLATVPFQPLQLPVIANVTAEPYPQNDAAAVRLLLVKQITHPVRWTRSIRHLIAQGVTSFNEIGPGNVLTRLIQQIQQEPDG
jgi:malonyl CoA-acyl carrier protein transacylase